MSPTIFYTAFGVLVGIPLAVAYVRWFVHHYREESKATENESFDDWSDRQI